MNILRTTISAGLSAQGSKAFGLDTASDPLAPSYTLTLTDGTGDQQCNQQWHGSRTLGAAAEETLDLHGTLTDAFGDTVNFARIKAILIQNTSPTGALTLGAAGANPWLGGLFGSGSDTLTIRPGGLFLIACSDATGYPVTNSTADQLRLANNDSANALVYKISLVGATA